MRCCFLIDDPSLKEKRSIYDQRRLRRKFEIVFKSVDRIFDNPCEIDFWKYNENNCPG